MLTRPIPILVIFNIYLVSVNLILWVWMERVKKKKNGVGGIEVPLG